MPEVGRFGFRVIQLSANGYEVTERRIGTQKVVSGKLLPSGKTYPDMELDFAYEVQPRKKWEPEVLLQAGDDGTGL